ncbi:MULTISPECIES: hypothetical protein [Sorangium]|uniref:Uncharacterized protein n=1 Tax=Sorangium cellulosum TaxID=56 RepID=A0A4P2R090_SORCE|nr:MULTISPECIES: hypothetical protein [Sorangium]AUX36309.1 hypothetical protein SOCE836_085160 [Sorangium cellulosum]WCQ95608.1 hypothetical protein NQZ70_08385 [Sorangium sp. Soce836]
MANKTSVWAVRSLSLLLLLGCNVAPPPGSTGGVTKQPDGCGRGLIVVNTDYQSTNVSLLDIEGAVLSSSLISSSAASTMLSVPLSGDVVLPTMPQLGSRIALIDRYPASVLTWIDVKSGEVAAQLSVATGFAANPQDYVEASPHKAYVTRLGQNLAAGSEPFDAGNDVLVIDPSVPSITGRIDLMPAMAGEDPKYLPRANRAVVADQKLYVLLSADAADFSSSAESRLVTIDTDTDTILDVKTLDGLHGCGALALSPDQEDIAVACTGTFVGSASVLSESALVVLSRGDSLVERERWSAEQLGGGALGTWISYAGAETLVFTTLGSFPEGDQPGTDDTASALNLVNGERRELLRSKLSPFTIGATQCVAECSACFIADAETSGGVVHRFPVSAQGALGQPSQTVVDTAIGLPPRYLGRF